MSEHNITVPGGTSVRLPTSGKYCDRDIIVTAEGSGGGETTVDLTAELTEQESIIAQIKAALEDKASGESGSTSFLGARMYTFGVLSDIHLRWGTGGPGTTNYNFRNGITDFDRAIPAIQNLGVEFVCITGDLGYDSDSSSVIKELELYQTALTNYATVPFYILTGNHDIKHSDEDWETYTGHPKNFEIVKDGDVFLFMSLTQPEKASSYATPYTTSLTWLRERIARYQGARIFIFMHYPITGYAGLRDGEYYGFLPDGTGTNNTEANELLSALISAKNVVLFNGHTHFELECEATYDTINVFTFQHKNVSIVHVPSCAYPRDYLKNEVPDLSEGYVVEVYEKGVILRGVNLAVEVDEENPKAHVAEYMPDYEYALMIDNEATIAYTTAIELSAVAVSLGSGESAEIEVSLTDPANTVVNLTESNDFITVSPASLTFTEDNYSTPQTVTITAGTLAASDSTMVTVSADGLTSRSISVSLTAEGSNVVEFPSGTVEYNPGDGNVFTGTVEGHQITTKGVSAGTYNLTFNNFSLTHTNTPVYIYNSGDVVTLNLIGNNSITATATTAQRAMSSSATTALQIIGQGDGATLTLTSNGTSQSLKGYYDITNADVAVQSNGTATVSVSTVGDGVNIKECGSFSINGAKVALLTATTGTGKLSVNLGSAAPGSATVTVTVISGTLSKLLVNGEETSSLTFTMPAVNETLTIQGVFA